MEALSESATPFQNFSPSIACALSINAILNTTRFSRLEAKSNSFGAMAVQKFALLVVVFLTITIAAAREIPADRSPESRLKISLLAETADGSGMVECWGSLLELRSCTNEIVLFFLKGEGYIGHDCCRAIRIITHQCWPSMLTTVGFTAEEGDILTDYCDMPPASGVAAPVPSPAPAPRSTAA